VVIVEPNSASNRINLPSPNVALDPISTSEQQHRFIVLAAQTDRNGPDARRFPAGFVELD
jgi:hypothetical protein